MNNNPCDPLQVSAVFVRLAAQCFPLMQSRRHDKLVGITGWDNHATFIKKLRNNSLDVLWSEQWAKTIHHKKQDTAALTPNIPWDQKLVDCCLGSQCEEK
jgi:hypothetical protein